MSQVAILSDIHGNLPAFKAVLREVAESGATEIVFGGDIVGYGASPKECVGLVRGLGGRCVMGNHDAYTRKVLRGGRASGASNGVWEGVVHAVRELDEDGLRWLWGMPMQLEIEGAVVAHSELSDPGQWRYLFDVKGAAPTLKILEERGIGVGFFGHTHMQKIFFRGGGGGWVIEEVAEGRILVPGDAACAVTVGSVGQPRGGDLRAGWVLWDPGERTVEFRRTEYPVVEAAVAILEAGLPEESAIRLIDDEGMDALFWGGHLG